MLQLLSWRDFPAARAESLRYSLMFLGLGLASGAAMLLQGTMFGISGEALTTRLRTRAFRSMLSQALQPKTLMD